MAKYLVNIKYSGADGFGIIPQSIEAENAKDAVRKVVRIEKERGNEVLAINGVCQIIKAPKSGWMSVLEEGEEVNG